MAVERLLAKAWTLAGLFLGIALVVGFATSAVGARDASWQASVIINRGADVFVEQRCNACHDAAVRVGAEYADADDLARWTTHARPAAKAKLPPFTAADQLALIAYLQSRQ